MKSSEAYNLYGTEEFERRERRQLILGNCILGVCYLLIAAVIFYWTIVLMPEFRGSDAWPSGVCLSLLFMYAALTLFRYWTQPPEPDPFEYDDE